jgi:SpoVK/Ycf46/Vps4 family AAA+-type ATPase
MPFYQTLGTPVQDECIDYIHPDLARLWLVRGIQLLSQLQRREILTGTSEPETTIREALGISRCEGTGVQLNNETTFAVPVTDHATLRQFEQGILFDNLRMLGRRIGLSPVELRILAFRVAFRLDGGLETLMDKMFPGWTDVSLYRRLARILDESESSIEQALSPQGMLSRACLLRVDSDLVSSFREKTGLVSGLINTLIRPHRSVSSLMAFLLSPVSAGSLTVADFPHLERVLEVTKNYLTVVAAKRSMGTHILLYGSPGTGKTELAKAMCADLGWKLYGLNSDTGDRGSNTGTHRLRSLFAAQRVLAHTKKSAILFDEIDDVVFADVKEDGVPILTKQFLNQFLEEAPVPVFWITNHSEQLDPAYLRRFDICIEVTNPPRSVRRELLRNACTGLDVSPVWIDQQAGIDQLTPALITRMAKVARLSATSGAQLDSGARSFPAAFSLIRDQHFRAHGKGITVEHESHALKFDPAAINATRDLTSLASQLKGSGTARLLFHGVPGAGKSAYARALANEIDRPLLPKMASDLLSPYLGETEQNIRKVFDHASRDAGVLLIDEVDSFLQSRERAVRSWEVAQVNEFLTQLERFEGIVVCTTNFIDHLDAAAMRRFDSKIEFLPLRVEQRLSLFRQLCQSVGIDSDKTLSQSAVQQLTALDTLTPGDFATVARQLRLFNTYPPITELVAALAEEQRYKPTGARRQMGFV